eukprot:jgi/Botrbrau1/11550/Bobra.60_1s0004.1
MAAEEKLAFCCSLNGKELPLQGGEAFPCQAGTSNHAGTSNQAGNAGHALHIEQAYFISRKNFNEDDIPLISLLTPAMQIAEAIPLPLDTDFAQVAINQVPTIFIPTASMPAFKFAFLKPAVSKDARPSHFNPMAIRTGHFDSSCNTNLMSGKAYEANKHLFTPAQIKGIKPFRINMADGTSHTMSLRVVEDLVICMQDAYYIATFLIIDNLAIDFLIGWAFMVQYDVQLKPQLSKYAIGLPRNQLMQNVSEKRTYQMLELAFKTKKMTLVVSS